jgi:hypothetical protein
MMKVRWTGESLRLRITPTELAGLLMGSEVRVDLALPGGGGWSVSLSPGARVPALRSRGTHVELRIPAADVELLSEGDREGVYFTPAGGHRTRWYVEKDFPCAHPHAKEACESETERFTPTETYLRRKSAAGGVEA